LALIYHLSHHRNSIVLARNLSGLLPQASFATQTAPFVPTAHRFSIAIPSKYNGRKRPFMKRLLIVDDNANFAFSLGVGLKRRNYCVDVAGDAYEAINRLEKDHYDALITDIRMPKLDGIGLARIAARLFPNITIILMSAYDFKEYEDKLKNKKAVQKIAKPFKLNQLTALIENTDVGEDEVKAE